MSIEQEPLWVLAQGSLLWINGDSPSHNWPLVFMAKPQTTNSGDICHSVQFGQILISTFGLWEGVAHSLPGLPAQQLQMMKNPTHSRAFPQHERSKHGAHVLAKTSGSTWQQCAWEVIGQLSSSDIHWARSAYGGALHLKRKSFLKTDLELASWYWLQRNSSQA